VSANKDEYNILVVCLFLHRVIVFFSAQAVNSADMLEKIGKELQCPICWNRLVAPKLLPCCQHTFCLDCIRCYVEGRNAAAAAQALCPVCRKSFRLPRAGAAALENNTIALRLLEITKPQS